MAIKSVEKVDGAQQVFEMGFKIKTSRLFLPVHYANDLASALKSDRGDALSSITFRLF